MKNIKIKPCYNCGDTDLTIRYDIHEDYSVMKIMCDNCGICWRIPIVDEDAESAHVNTKAVFNTLLTWNRMERIV